MDIVKRPDAAGGVRCLLTGRLDAHQVPRLKAELDPLPPTLHLDLSGVTFIDSSGLAALVGLYKKARETGGHFTISGLQDAVRLILELTGLHAILPIVPAPGVP